MKKLLITAAICVAALFSSGCADKYLPQVEELERKTQELQKLCEKYNENIVALNALAATIQTKDMVTGITVEEDGYTINFVKHDPVKIYNGADAEIPMVSIKRDDADGVSYWTVQYGNGPVEWIKDADGNRINSIGEVPYLTIRNNIWYLTYDGVNYISLGDAKGAAADTMFRSFDTSNENYVIITLASGDVLKIPRFAAYEQLNEDVTTTNTNTLALNTILTSIRQNTSYVTSVTPVTSAFTGDTLGINVKLSNGGSATIMNDSRSNVPYVYAVADDKDGLYYWGTKFDDTDFSWILTPEGERVRAVGDTATTPVISMMQDPGDGEYYWAISVNGSEPRIITTSEGGKTKAIDYAKKAIFTSYDNSDSEYLTVTLVDGSTYTLPKEYSVSIQTSIKMKPSEIRSLEYTVYGDNEGKTIVTAIGQKGFKADVNSDGQIIITAPESFTTGTNQVVVIFNICGLASKTKVKSIDITRN